MPNDTKAAETGPQGELANSKPEVRKDPATGKELPREIAGRTLPSNFNSSRPTTWPIGLTREQVDKWVLGGASVDSGSDLIPKAQPSKDQPVDAEGNSMSLRELGEQVVGLSERVAQLECQLEVSQMEGGRQEELEALHVEDLKKLASELEIPGRSEMNKSELVENILAAESE